MGLRPADAASGTNTSAAPGARAVALRTSVRSDPDRPSNATGGWPYLSGWAGAGWARDTRGLDPQVLETLGELRAQWQTAEN